MGVKTLDGVGYRKRTPRRILPGNKATVSRAHCACSSASFACRWVRSALGVSLRAFSIVRASALISAIMASSFTFHDGTGGAHLPPVLAISLASPFNAFTTSARFASVSGGSSSRVTPAASTRGT